MENEIGSHKKIARLAGLIYLIWILTGLFAMFYIPSRINMQGDAIATAQNILSHEFLFRIGIINDLISSVLWVFLAFILLRLFKEVNERQAKLLVALVIVQIPVAFIMEAFSIASLMIFKGEILRTFELNQRQDLAIIFMKINDYIVLVLETFWGLWLMPLALLVYRCRFIPRFLGIWLMVDGIALVILSFTSLLFPQYKDIVYKISFPAMLGEMVFMLWLLIMGAKNDLSLPTKVS